MMKDQPNSFTFSYDNNDNEFAQNISLTFSCGDPKLSDLHQFVKIFARALGFHHELVEEYFGEDVYDD